MVKSTSGAEFNGLIYSMEQMMLLQFALHQIYRDINQSPEVKVDLLETDKLHPFLDLGVDARNL